MSFSQNALELWLAFPDIGILSCYQAGMVKGWARDAVRPRDFQFPAHGIWEDED